MPTEGKVLPENASRTSLALRQLTWLQRLGYLYSAGVFTTACLLTMSHASAPAEIRLNVQTETPSLAPPAKRPAGHIALGPVSADRADRSHALSSDRRRASHVSQRI